MEKVTKDHLQLQNIYTAFKTHHLLSKASALFQNSVTKHPAFIAKAENIY